MANTSIDAESLVTQLWEDVRARDSMRASLDSLRLGGGDRMQHLWDLVYLNHHWDIEQPNPAHVAGNTVKRRVKSTLARFVVHLLAKYFSDTREFRAHVVRVANALARSHDEVVDDIAKLAEALRTESRRLADRDATLHALLEERLDRLERVVADGDTQR